MRIAVVLAVIGLACAKSSDPPPTPPTEKGKPEAPVVNDKDTPAGEEVTIPKDLEDAFAELDKKLSAEDKANIKSGETKAVDMHFGLGMWMRNNWKLWGGGSPLAKHLQGLGLRHPDDMSGLILTSYVRRLRGEPLEVDKQVEHYKAYWAEMKAKQE